MIRVSSCGLAGADMMLYDLGMAFASAGAEMVRRPASKSIFVCESVRVPRLCACKWIATASVMVVTVPSFVIRLFIGDSYFVKFQQAWRDRFVEMIGGGSLVTT
jgi:hypothetical protein